MSGMNSGWYDYEGAATPGRRRFAPQPQAVPLRKPPHPPEALRFLPHLSPVLFLPLLLCFFTTAALLIPLGLGIEDGQRDRILMLKASAEEHYRRALAYEAENYIELAFTEVQLALHYDPNYAPARAKLLALQDKLAPSGTPAPLNVGEQLYKQAAEAVAKQEWDDAIGLLEEVRRTAPGLHAEEVSQMLYDAYMGGGRLAVAAGNVELARQRYEAALALRPNDAAAKQQRDLARAYLTGQRAAGFDWGVAVSSYQEVYSQDPNYADVRRQLYHALLSNGDLAVKQGAWCVAARQYDRAQQLSPSPTLAQNVATASANCRNAVLTPAPTPAPPVNGTPEAENGGVTPAPQNLPPFAAQVRVEGGACAIAGTVRDSNNQPLADLTIRYYNEAGVDATVRTDTRGYYEFPQGKNASRFYVLVLGPDGRTPASPAVEVDYPGAGAPGCRLIVDWTRLN